VVTVYDLYYIQGLKAFLCIAVSRPGTFTLRYFGGVGMRLPSSAKDILGLHTLFFFILQLSSLFLLYSLEALNLRCQTIFRAFNFCSKVFRKRLYITNLDRN